MGMPLNFTVNLTGVKPLGSYVLMPEIPFKARIDSIEVNPHKEEPGASVATIHLVVTEPGYEGATRRIRNRIPDATEKGQNARRGWRTLLESVGYTGAQLDSGQAVQITEQTLKGKEGHFFHKPAPAGVEGAYDEVETLTPSAYEERKRALAVRGGGITQQVQQPQGGGAALGAPANGAGQPQVQAPQAAADLRASLLS